MNDIYNLETLVYNRYPIGVYDSVDMIFDLHLYLKGLNIVSEIKQGWLTVNNISTVKVYMCIKYNGSKYTLYVDDITGEIKITKGSKCVISKNKAIKNNVLYA